MKKQWVFFLLLIGCTAFAVFMLNKPSGEFDPNVNQLKWIQIPEGVLLPTAEQIAQGYTATLKLGEQQFRFDDFVHFLGEGAKPIPGTEGREERNYQSVDHWTEYPCTLKERLAEVQKNIIGGFTHDGLDFETGTAITEGGGEREAPPIGLSVDDVIARCKEYLLLYMDESYLSHPDLLEGVLRRWDLEKNEWLTSEAYQDQLMNEPRVYIHYGHIYENGLKIDDLNEGIKCVMDAAGLTSFSASWHNFDPQPEQVLPMPLDEALVLAEMNRQSPTWLLSAELVYSNVTNAETDGEKYDLHWLITTRHGKYYINCVTGKRWADRNE